MKTLADYIQTIQEREMSMTKREMEQEQHQTLSIETINELRSFIQNENSKLAVEDFRQWLRNQLKHGDYTMEQQQALEVAWEEFHRICSDNGVFL